MKIRKKEVAEGKRAGKKDEFRKSLKHNFLRNLNKF